MNPAILVSSYDARSIPDAPIPAAPASAAFATAFHPTLCRSDAANTIPCATGDLIRWQFDLISSTWFEQPIVANRLTMQKDAGSGKYYGVSNSKSFHQFGWVVDPSVNGSKFTIGVGVTGTDPINGDFGPWFDCSVGTNGYSFGCGVALHLQDPSITFMVNYLSSSQPGGQALVDGRYVVQTTTGAANMNVNIYLNGSNILAVPTALLPLTNANAINLGACSAKAAVSRSFQSGNLWGLVGYADNTLAFRNAGDAWIAGLMP